MRIGIIGGSGFIGTRLTRRLIASGRSVKIIDKAKSAFYPDLWEPADVRDPEALARACSGCEALVNLAAEHRDDVSPKSLYYDVNVAGARNLCAVAEKLGVGKIVFTSSVAVYGFAPPGTDESGELKPFNEYGTTKALAEKEYLAWSSGRKGRSLTIIRPTVVFGERNRGNVYNLLRQISSSKFMMVGDGKNAKSMAYVENVAGALEFALSRTDGVEIYNYVDGPDLDMNALVSLVRERLGKPGGIGARLPYWAGYAGGVCLDLVAKALRMKFPISAIRVRKFCSTTKFAADAIRRAGYEPFVSLAEGIERTIDFEFLGKGRDSGDDTVFVSE